MSCEDAQKANLVAHLYGELEGEEAREFRKHLEECSECRRELEELTRVHETLSELRELEEPWRAAAPVAAPRREGIGERLRRWLGNPVAMPRWALGGALAALVLLAVIAVELDVTREEGALRLSWGVDHTEEIAATAGATGQGARLESWTESQRAAWDEALLTEVTNMLDRSEERQVVAVAQLMEYYTRQIEAARSQDLRAVGYGLGSVSEEARLELARTNNRLQQVVEMLMNREGSAAAGSAVPGQAEVQPVSGQTGSTGNPDRR